MAQQRLPIVTNQPTLVTSSTPNITLRKNDIVKSFLTRNQTKQIDTHCYNKESFEPFAQTFKKFTVREFQHNTRLNIRNVDHKNEWEKRQRMIGYWQDRVVQNHLPPIDVRKKQEMSFLKKETIQRKIKARKPADFSVNKSIAKSSMLMSDD